ncbi:MAG: hypothetical protein ABIA02_01455 [Candidatus Falkowbacteria bacterium]
MEKNDKTQQAINKLSNEILKKIREKPRKKARHLRSEDRKEFLEMTVSKDEIIAEGSYIQMTNLSPESNSFLKKIQKKIKNIFKDLGADEISITLGLSPKIEIKFKK